MTVVRQRHRALVALALAAVLLFQAISGPASAATQLAALVAATSLGMPHGALDHLAAKPLLRPRFGRWWPAPFVAGYLGLAGLTVAIWTLAPGVALAGFLGLAAVHFGLGDAEDGGRTDVFAVLAHGGAPIVVSALAHSGEVARLFGLLAGDDAPPVLAALTGPVALAWAAGMAMLAWRARSDQAARAPLAELAAVVAAFALLPPLLAFALYFGALHAPRALIGATRDTGMPFPALLRTAAVPSLAALVLIGGGALLLWEGAEPSVALVRSLFIGLAALTAPHMALAAWRELDARRRSQEQRR